MKYGWIDNPVEAAKVASRLDGINFLKAHVPVKAKETVVLTDFTKKITPEIPAGPQGIGDCVSWGWGNGINILQCTQLLNIVKQESDKLFEKLMVGEASWSDVSQELQIEYQEIATESVYGFSRCEVGKQWNSYEDGSVGAWAAKASEQFGYLSRNTVGPYDPQRAKQWGAKGVPDNFEPQAKVNIVKACTPVNTFELAADLIQGGHPVPVCSDRGFSLQRDSQGFCAPSGTWYHCMLFMGVRWDRPGLLCMQSWGKNNPNGPLVLNQPSNTFWVDANVAQYMLGKNDSYGPTYFNGFRTSFDWSF